MVEDLNAYVSALAKMVDDEAVLPSEKMHALLVGLGEVQVEMLRKAAPFKAIIEAEQAKMAKVIVGHEMAVARIKAGIQECLEVFFEHDNWTFEGEAGKAQIVRPKNRISYDTKGLETLRRSSDQVDRLIAHLRKEAPSKPYLKVKLK